MKFNFFKKMGALGVIIAMMATTVMADAWTITMNDRDYTASKDATQKTINSSTATIKRTDIRDMWLRCPCMVYVKGKDTNHKSTTATLGYSYGNGSATVSYYNYSSSFVGEEFQTYGMLTGSAYASMQIPGETTP